MIAVAAATALSVSDRLLRLLRLVDWRDGRSLLSLVIQ